MLNLAFVRQYSRNLFQFSASLAAGLILSGCQSMPWSNSSIQSDTTPTVAENPSNQKVVFTQKTSAKKKDLAPEKFLIKQTQSEKPHQVDIWPRLFSGYALNKPANKRVQREYDWYSKHPEYLARVQDRAEPFLYYILNEAEKRQMPTELVLLPVVESAFQPFAYSPGRASGLWQFIPSTGRMYGLQQNWWYDGRRDVVASTQAALDYLQALSRQFDGDWELALAAYNAGAGNVRKAIRKNRKKGRPTDYWSLPLPRETQTYVPRLLAISKIFKDADKLGIKLKNIPDKAQLETVAMDTQIDLAKVAEMTGLSIEDIYNLNPGFNRWATLPDSDYTLLLPYGTKAVFEDKLASLDKSELIEWQRYKIKKGDSLSLIAKKHGTTMGIIKDINKLRSSKIRAGKHLLIPIAAKKPEAYSLSAVQRQQQHSNKKQKGNRFEYIVKSGDTLWDIARAHKLTHKKIARWNGMAPGDPLRPGQKLVLWLKASSTATSVAFTDAPVKHTSNIRYTIRKGDSLSRIASKFNVSVNELRKWNSLNKKYLQPGQTLRLKVKVTEQL